MRGIMVQSLVSRGVPFDIALETANTVREQIAHRGDVSRHELSKLVEDLLGDRLDLEAVPPELPTPTVRDARGTAVPFSKGIMAVSLQGAGMDTSDA